MGANASKEGAAAAAAAAAADAAIPYNFDGADAAVPSAEVKTPKFAELLVEPTVKRRFDDLLKLVKHNNRNDINYLARTVAEFQKEKLPVLLGLSKSYTQMLKQVAQMKPEFKSEVECFNFLSDDQNLMKFLYWQTGSDDPVIQSVLTGQESPNLVSSVKGFMNDLHVRDAKLKYFQFKYAQTALFQAAFVQSMWHLANVFVQSTQAFHRLRETVFGSVFKQMTAIVKKYTGADDISLQDVDELDKLTKKLNSVRDMAEIKDKMENQKMTNIKDLLQDLIKMDSEIATQPGLLLPTPPGVVQGLNMKSGEPVTIKATGYGDWKQFLRPETPAKKPNETDEEYARRVDEIKQVNKSITDAFTKPGADFSHVIWKNFQQDVRQNNNNNNGRHGRNGQRRNGQRRNGPRRNGRPPAGSQRGGHAEPDQQPSDADDPAAKKMNKLLRRKKKKKKKTRNQLVR
jgi:hypothetical protein